MTTYEDRFQILRDIAEVAYDQAACEYEGRSFSDATPQEFNHRVYRLTTYYVKRVDLEAPHVVRDYLGDLIPQPYVKGERSR